MMNLALIVSGLLAILGDETLFMPGPTAEIKALIVKLGDDDYFVREKSSKKLEDIGWPALKGLAVAIRTTEDLETKVRAERLYTAYFGVSSNDKDNYRPSIWHMDEKKRFPDGFKLEKATQDHMGSTCKVIEGRDVAREYYERAMHELKLVKDGVGDCGWQDEGVARLAGHLYAKDMLKVGVKREDVKKVLNGMADNAKKYVHYYQTDNIDSPSYDWNQKPPGPMINKEDFKEPYWGP